MKVLNCEEVEQVSGAAISADAQYGAGVAVAIAFVGIAVALPATSVLAGAFAAGSMLSSAFATYVGW